MSNEQLNPTNNEENSNKKIILTQEQQLKILEALDKGGDAPPTIKELILLAFGQVYDARTQYGKAIREFIADKGLRFRGAREYIPPRVIELTEEQKKFIGNNWYTMKALEMARILFQNDNLTNLSLETRAVYAYIKQIPKEERPSYASPTGDELNVEDYRPPKTIDQTIARANQYISIPYDRSKLTEREKRQIKALQGYLHVLRFLNQINTYAEVKYRELFESTFIRCVHDKDNLNEEEVDQYIIYSAEVVIGSKIEKRIEDLEIDQDTQRAENGGRINMSLVEAVSSLRNEFNQCVTRQRNLLKALQGERKERLKNDGKNRENLLDLIIFVQNEEKRKKLLAWAAVRREKIKNEIDRIKNMDQLKSEIYGLDEIEILD